MLKERYQFVRQILFVVELCFVSANYFFFYYLIVHFHRFYRFDIFRSQEVVPPPHSLDRYMAGFWLSLLLWAAILRFSGDYQHLRARTIPQTIGRSLFKGLLFFGLFTSLAFILKFDFLSRIFIVGYTLSTTFWLALAQSAVVITAHVMRRQGKNVKPVLVVGTGRRAQEFLSLIARHREWGYRVVGLLDRDAAMSEKKVAGYPVLGGLEMLPSLLTNHVVDEVFFVVPRNWLKDIERCILYCEAVGIPATLSTDFFDLEVAKGVPREFDGLTYLTFETRRLQEPELFAKRLVDIGAGIFFLTFFFPVMALAAVAIRLDSPGPLFFRQRRVGSNGREFTLYKFRSMSVDAEKRLADLMEKNEMSGPVFKMENDPRVTKVGRLLRKTSLDEFPQFWNVLKGDMSLVGPRPPLPKEVEQYEPWQRRRLSMKPGITCIWQVSGRNQIGFEDWMKLDLQYIDHWSLWLDFKIIALTVKAVLTQHGAK